MSNRICIHSEGKVNAHISAEYLVSCCYSCGFGCNGGFPGAAWTHWVKKGIVTGGNFNSSQGITEWSLVTEWTVPKKCCLIEIRPVIETTPYLTNKTCTTVRGRFINLISRIPLTFLFLLTGASSYSLRKHVQDIQLEIMNNGPVEGALTVYEDFLVYKSGMLGYYI